MASPNSVPPVGATAWPLPSNPLVGAATGAESARDGPHGAHRVALLAVWLDADSTWHARMVGVDGVPHEFTSPVELARFLNRLARPAPAADGRGLR